MTGTSLLILLKEIIAVLLGKGSPLCFKCIGI